jgi:flagellar biosynthesis/type III secretory pathway protein FliH
LEGQKTEIAQLFQALKRLVDELNRFYKEVLDKHKEEIASLSVEIANKVLMQKVQKGDYRIESIITEALKNVPTCQDVVVHLNPEDMTQYQKLKQDSIGDALPVAELEGIKFVADSNIGRAECMLETPKGIVKSFVEQHLEKIREALAKVE